MGTTQAQPMTKGEVASFIVRGSIIVFSLIVILTSGVLYACVGKSRPQVDTQPTAEAAAEELTPITDTTDDSKTASVAVRQCTGTSLLVHTRVPIQIAIDNGESRTEDILSTVLYYKTDEWQSFTLSGPPQTAVLDSCPLWSPDADGVWTKK